MCRFLLIRSEGKISPLAWLGRFAAIAERSRAPDGDRQADGWGIAWLDDRNNWQIKRSLLPVWEDVKSFKEIPGSKTFAIHARSASFPEHKGNINFNQPYVSGDYAFVFNGLLKGVSLSDVPGEIGAEKIWYLLREELKANSSEKALENVKKTLAANSREIIALNIGLASKDGVHSLNYFTQHPEYYTLYEHNNGKIKTICSENIFKQA